MNSRLLLAVLLAAAMLAGCESTSSSKQPAPPPVPQIPQPPPPQEAPAPYRAQLHQEIAAGFYERGQMDVALQELDQAVKLDPKNAKIYNTYGLVYATLGKDSEAQRNFQQALDLAPDDPEIRQNWGWFLCTHGKAKESIAQFDRAVSDPLYKTPDIALANAGKCSVEIGDYGRAAEYFKRALQINPGNIPAAYSLSLLAYREGRFEEARGLVKRVTAVPNPAPDALYLGMCIERKLGDRTSEAAYVSQLRNRYPNAPETKAVTSGECQ